jgi:hypothetical protein
MEGNPNYDSDALAFAQKMAGGGGGNYGFTPTPMQQQMPDYYAKVPNGNPQGQPTAPQDGYNRLAQMLQRSRY